MDDRRQVRNRSLYRHALVLLLVVVAGVVTYAIREVPDPAHEAALALGSEMDAVFAAVVAEELDLPDVPAEVAAGVVGADITAGQRSLGVLTGVAGGECYAHWWDAELVRHARVLAVGIPCEPATIVTSIRPIHYTRLGAIVAAPEGPYDWISVVPPPVRLRAWFLPVGIVAIGVALSIVTRMVSTLVTGVPPGQLAREERARRH
jgi:hypothetical protein